MNNITQEIKVLSKDAPVTVIQNNTIYQDPRKAGMTEIKQKMAEILEVLGKPKLENLKALAIVTAFELNDFSTAKMVEYTGSPYGTIHHYKNVLNKGGWDYGLISEAGDNK